MKRRILHHQGIVLACLFLACRAAPGATNWYVRTDGNDSSDGTNWSTAFQTISNAMAHVQDWDTVLVSNGTYAVSNSIALSNAVTVRGVSGASNTIVAVSPAYSDFRCFTLSHTGAVVEGFSIQKGHPLGGGGGVYLTAGTVRDCIIEQNRSYYNSYLGWCNGGGVYMAGGVVEDCVIRSNLCYEYTGGGGSFGGGVYVTGGTLRGCIVYGNSATNPYYGGGAYGGGIYVNGSGAVAENCLVYDNNCNGRSTEGGGVGWGRGGGVNIENGTLRYCTIADNRADLDGGGLRHAGGTVVNCVIYNNTATNFLNYFGGAATYSCAPELVSGPGNIAAAPVFEDRTNDNYRLSFASPCVDAGTNTVAVTNDLDRLPRPVDGLGGGLTVADMGCFERVAPTNVSTFQCTFRADQTLGLYSLTPVFTAGVAGPPASTASVYYTWSLGTNTLEGAGLSGVTNTYSLGSYTVTLTVSNSLSEVTNLTRPLYIMVITNATFLATNGADAPPYASWDTAAHRFDDALAYARLSLGLGAPDCRVTISNGSFAVNAEVVLTQAVHVAGVAGRDTTVLSRYASQSRVFNLGHSNAIVSGVTIRDGFAPGAGLYLTAGTVSNCVIRNNQTFYTAYCGPCQGGGIYMTGGTVDQCLVTSNLTYHSLGAVAYGGGIYASGGTIRRSVITGNTATNGPYGAEAHGGGIYMAGAGAVVEDCLIYTNRSQGPGGYGGGVEAVNGTVRNCTVSFNSAATQDGGIRHTGGAVENCIVWYNSSPGGSPDYSGSTAIYSCAPELVAGEGNLNLAPVFVGAPTNFRIQLTSPCVDTGTNRAWMTGATDLDDSARIQNSRVDMGAYEYIGGSEFGCTFSTTNARIGYQALSNVVFTAMLSGTPPATNHVYFWWDFGGGTTPQEGYDLLSVTNTFGLGLFTVTLTVSNELAQTSGVTRAGYIKVGVGTMYVSGSGASVYPYGTWGNAATNLRTAFSELVQMMNLGVSYGYLWITNGTYGINAELTITNPIAVYGVNGMALTTVRRDGTGGAHGVFTLNHSNAVINGLTIRDGYEANDYAGSQYQGAGVSLYAGKLLNCLVTANRVDAGGDTANTGGGGVYVANGGLVSNCIIRGNSLYGGYLRDGRGGGLKMSGGVVMDTGISNNWCYGGQPSWGGYAYGGGAFLTDGTLRRCIIQSNRCESTAYGYEQGGGVYMTGGLLESCLVYTNVTGGSGTGTNRYGGGVAMAGAGARLQNTTVVGNAMRSGSVGGGVFRSAGVITNTIVYFNTVAGVSDNLVGGGATYSCAPELVSGEGNITGDPQFRSAASGDLHLRYMSPCVNKGAKQDWMAGALDLGRSSRVMDGFPDIGAYEAETLGTIFVIR